MSLAQHQSSISGPTRSITAAADDEPLCQRAGIPVLIRPCHGTKPVRVRLHYLWYGCRIGPTVIVQGGISAGRDACSSPAHGADGWWQSLVGPGKAIDTRRCRVLAIDWLDAEALQADTVTSLDQAEALAALLDGLHIGQAAAFVGASYGAMVGLAFAARHGERIGHLIAIAGAHRPHPLATAQRAIQRGILRLGMETGRELDAVSLARQLALTTYRGHGELGERFTGAARPVADGWQLPVETWLQHGGRKFARGFSARRYLSLSQSIDLHAVDPAAITAPVNLIGIASDRLVPLTDLCVLQSELGGRASLEVIDSPCGHDAFLVEHARLTPLLGDALGGCLLAPGAPARLDLPAPSEPIRAELARGA